MRRELRSANTERVLGAVVIDDGKLTLEGGAQDVLRYTVQKLGADAGKILMDEGWSNGYLYLAPSTA